ncbi:MAG: hypothetical protein V3574_03920 [Candidatus Moraniibacteriota bacterium]
MSVKESLESVLRVARAAVPMIVGILLLISLLNPVFQKYYPLVFSGNYFWDPLWGALAGSIAFGMPVTSYIVGGELLQRGVSLVAITAFILAWATVGLAMLPIEIKFFGTKFALLRNGLNFINSIIIAVLTVAILKIL